MKSSLKHLLIAALVVPLAAFTLPVQANISPQQSRAILTHFSETLPTDFREFLRQLGVSAPPMRSDLGAAISGFLTR